MILRPGAFLRTGALLFAALVLQLSAVEQITILGGQIDLIPLTLAAIAFYAGSVAGCATGFTMGLLLDLATGQTVGASSLVLSALGYSVGRLRELRDPSHALLPLAVAAGATLAWEAAFAAVSFMLDIQASVSPLVAREALLTTLLNAAVALPVFAFVRRVTRPVLAVDPVGARRRGRPVRETGPLGLRGLEV